jgi:hypothetical protein
MGGDQQTVPSDRLARKFQFAPDPAIFDISRHIERQHRYRVEDIIDPLQQPGRCLLRATISQFSRDDNACADCLIADRRYTLSGLAPGFLIKSEMMFVSSM